MWQQKKAIARNKFLTLKQIPNITKEYECTDKKDIIL